MWRNAEVDAFVHWLHRHNLTLPAGDRTSFHGLDLYSLSASIGAVVEYLDRVDPQAAAVARERYACLAPWSAEPAAYGHMALRGGYEQCERDVPRMLRGLPDKRRE